MQIYFTEWRLLAKRKDGEQYPTRQDAHLYSLLVPEQLFSIEVSASRRSCRMATGNIIVLRISYPDWSSPLLLKL